MTRSWFSRFAFALLLLAIFIDQGRPSASISTSAPPPVRAIELMKEAGLSYLDNKALSSHNEALLTFSAPGCQVPIGLLYLPASYPQSAEARTVMGSAKGRAVIIYGGKAIGGAMWDLVPRLIWARLLAAFYFKPKEALDALVLVMFVPPNCETPAVEWERLAVSD